MISASEVRKLLEAIVMDDAQVKIEDPCGYEDREKLGFSSLHPARVTEARRLLELFPKASDTITFTIPGAPFTWKRTNTVMIKGRPMQLTDKEMRGAQEKVLWCFKDAAPGHRPWIRPVTIEFWFYVPDRVRRDWDNLSKLITDALNGWCYVDDSQIVDASIHKRLDRKNPRSEVRLAAMQWTQQNERFVRTK